MVQTHAEVSSPENISEIPQRSRNARAQARHRAKRKAYIERLEENVAKLQAVLGLSSDQVAELPPAAVLTNRYAELEMENRQLHEQLRSLQNAIQNGRIHLDDHNPTRWSPGSPTVAEFPQFGFMTSDDGQVCREAKKRKISFDAGLSYPSNNHPLLGGSLLHAALPGLNQESGAHRFVGPFSCSGALCESLALHSKYLLFARLVRLALGKPWWDGELCSTSSPPTLGYARWLGRQPPPPSSACLLWAATPLELQSPTGEGKH
ncbi:hypothetical protein FRC16_008065 [Serendipita sp. 398]|nr:hypothetical protein FRC16_008065 [Serendipita sp. 398]